MCATRFTIAGVVMLAWCALTGRRVRHSPRDLFHMAVVGILLLMGGNLTLSYAERIVPTGLSALLYRDHAPVVSRAGQSNSR